MDRISRKRIDELEQERPYIVSKPYPKNLGNATLRKEGLDISRGIKDLYLREADYQSEWMHSSTIDRNATELERSKQFQESRRQYDKARLNIQAVYWKDYQTKAILLRDEMRERLAARVRTPIFGNG